MALSTDSLPNSGYLLSAWLSYQNIKNRFKTTRSRPNQTANHWVRSCLSIAPFENLNTDLLNVFDNLDKNINSDGVDDKLALEAVANQALLQEDTSFYLNSDFESNTNSDSNFNSDFDSETDYKPDFQDINNTLQSNSSYFGISSFNTSYTCKKLVKILTRDVIIPK